VGQDEQSFPAVAGADFLRAEYSDRNAATQSLQCRDGNGKLSVRIPSDVFAEEGVSPALVENLDCPVEQPSLVEFTAPFSGNAVPLARVARHDAIHCATPCSSVECGKVIPDRSRMKPPCRHRRNHARGGAGFPLHVTDANRLGSGNSDADVEPADACTNADGM